MKERQNTTKYENNPLKKYENTPRYDNSKCIYKIQPKKKPDLPNPKHQTILKSKQLNTTKHLIDRVYE